MVCLILDKCIPNLSFIKIQTIRRLSRSLLKHQSLSLSLVSLSLSLSRLSLVNSFIIAFICVGFDRERANSGEPWDGMGSGVKGEKCISNSHHNEWQKLFYLQQKTNPNTRYASDCLRNECCLIIVFTLRYNLCIRIELID